MKVKSTGEYVVVPHGMVVWSTGVGTRPFVRDFMEEIGQGKRWVLATDEWLRVKGCPDVYAIGDCTTVDQRKIMVAAQQGSYLAGCFNRWEKCNTNPEGPRVFGCDGRHAFRPFTYRHLGKFAPLGGSKAAAELPGDWVSMGRSTQWLWYSVYAR
ncbi:hypothetical protein RND71_012318 [Anisodus tanguticus]|uniref:FAD/NAD(P)-binding domain-containing protein n=1 Tax=Anisodus tanguticus TaxID=243964 RepID=A0AAE1SGS4_9SOLA|nr:hypothetical protein RND71_012318 [Anisodus tanguticus]